MPVKANTPPKGDKLRVRQSANRAEYDRNIVCQILDAAVIGHVAFVDDGWPQSIPTAIARLDDHLYLHGSRSSRLYKLLATGERICVSVCLVDGLVKARSAFHCSMNYRSVVIFGCPEPVTGEYKLELLDRFTEHLIPGTANDYRAALPKEIKATELIRLSLTEASAKVRTGDPIDDDEDLDLPQWAGIIPLSVSVGAPVNSSNLPQGVDPGGQMLEKVAQFYSPLG